MVKNLETSSSSKNEDMTGWGSINGPWERPVPADYEKSHGKYYRMHYVEDSDGNLDVIGRGEVSKEEYDAVVAAERKKRTEEARKRTEEARRKVKEFFSGRKKEKK